MTFVVGYLVNSQVESVTGPNETDGRDLCQDRGWRGGQRLWSRQGREGRSRSSRLSRSWRGVLSEAVVGVGTEVAVGADAWMGVEAGGGASVGPGESAGSVGCAAALIVETVGVICAAIGVSVATWTTGETWGTFSPTGCLGVNCTSNGSIPCR